MKGILFGILIAASLGIYAAFGYNTMAFVSYIVFIVILISIVNSKYDITIEMSLLKGPHKKIKPYIKEIESHYKLNYIENDKGRTEIDYNQLYRDIYYDNNFTLQNKDKILGILAELRNLQGAKNCDTHI